MKLLIVEDNASVRSLIRRVVAGPGDETDECADGRGAVEAYRRSRPDWVLMDIVMEQTDGIAATKQIKAIDSDARIIIVTSYDEIDLREAAAAAGACGYVLKENLFEVRRLLDASRAEMCG